MGKVKQAIVDVHEEVADIVQGSLIKTPISYQMYRLFYSKSIGIRITMNIF